MLYVIVDKRDNTFYCGKNNWFKLEENAIWYGENSLHNIADMNDTLSILRKKEGCHFYAEMIPVEG